MLNLGNEELTLLLSDVHMCITGAMVFKYADGEQIKREWMEKDCERKCQNRTEQSCMSHNTS